MRSDWSVSAEAWIASLGDLGDRGRRHVLDPAFNRWIAKRRFARALDVGCGEGRLCRWLQGLGIEPVGLDPTPELIAVARQRDPGGTYLEAGAEAMPVADGAFDLVISCLSLIDIPDYRAAIAEMARALAPGGSLLVANVADYNSAAGQQLGWIDHPPSGGDVYAFDHYLEERSTPVSWAGISVTNHHRPLHAYMQAFLGAGLILDHYDMPAPVDAPPDFWTRYCRAPWFVVMSWRKDLEAC